MKGTQKDLTESVQNATLAIDIDFLYNNWKNLDEFIEEFKPYETAEDKRKYFLKTYGDKYYKIYNEYPKLVLKS